LRVGKEYATTTARNGHRLDVSGNTNDNENNCCLLHPDCPGLSALSFLLLAWLEAPPPPPDKQQQQKQQQHEGGGSGAAAAAAAAVNDMKSTDNGMADTAAVDMAGWRLYTSLLPKASALGNAVTMTPEERLAWAAIPGDDGKRWWTWVWGWG
jgi:hypothetical protein